MNSEYDDTLGSFLLQNNFDASNITDICRTGLSIERIDRRDILEAVKKIQNNHKTGCIFTLPTDRRDNTCWIFYSSMASDEIRRVVAMKVFL